MSAYRKLKTAQAVSRSLITKNPSRELILLNRCFFGIIRVDIDKIGTILGIFKLNFETGHERRFPKEKISRRNEKQLAAGRK